MVFMSRTLQGCERNYTAVEKEATACIEALRKWRHWLLQQHFVLITDPRAVSFMLDNTCSTKIKNNKIQQWRIELAEYSYTIKYRPGPRNVGPDSLTRAYCSAIIPSVLMNIHNELSHPGVTRMLHYVKIKN